MQPQNEPVSPNPQYDFIMSDPNQKPGRKLPLPNLPRGAWIALIGSVTVLFILVLTVILFGGNSGTSNSYVDALARSQEIIRVSNQVETESRDPLVSGLAATTETALLSNNARLNSYLGEAGIKVDPAGLAAYLDESTDAQLAEATQNNRLAEAYSLYLKSSLAGYQASLQAAYEQAPADAQVILEEAYGSTEIILKSPLVAAAEGS